MQKHKGMISTATNYLKYLMTHKALFMENGKGIIHKHEFIIPFNFQLIYEN